MKTTELISKPGEGTAAGVAKAIVKAVLKQNYVEEDIEKAVGLAIMRFSENIKKHATEELKFQRLKKI